jgi:hypothetical protein
LAASSLRKAGRIEKRTNYNQFFRAMEQVVIAPLRTPLSLESVECRPSLMSDRRAALDSRRPLDMELSSAHDRIRLRRRRKAPKTLTI